MLVLGEAPTATFPAMPFNLGQAVPAVNDEATINSNIWGLVIANIGAIAFGLAADYAIKEKTEASRRIITASTIGVSLIAVFFSFRVVLQPMTLPINPFWRVFAGFLTYMNTVVGLRSGFDFFKDAPEMPALHKFAREILKI
jgi:hypothetical protein